MNNRDFDGKIQVGHKYQTQRGVARCVDDDIVGSGYRRFLLIVRVRMSSGAWEDRDVVVGEDGEANKSEYTVESEIEAQP
jgi:hypothetical protein